MQCVARGEVARERLDALGTDRRVARAALLEEKLSAQHQALRHHRRPVARRRQGLRLLQDEEGELHVSTIARRGEPEPDMLATRSPRPLNFGPPRGSP